MRRACIMTCASKWTGSSNPGQAQFTPRTVETQTEREKLVFRVKLRIPRELLEKYEEQVKVGVRGIGFVRTDTRVAWPAQLVVNVPQ